MVGGCGMLLERGVVGGDGMLDWGNDEGGTLYGGDGAGGIRGVYMYSMYECIQYLFLETCNIWGII